LEEEKPQAILELQKQLEDTPSSKHSKPKSPSNQKLKKRRLIGKNGRKLIE